MQVVYPRQKRPRHLQHRSSSLFECRGKVGASSSDAGGDASSSNPDSAAAVAAPEARVQAPTVSEDEDSAGLIVPEVKVAPAWATSECFQTRRSFATHISTLRGLWTLQFICYHTNCSAILR
jgi:hypothetical protein